MRQRYDILRGVVLTRREANQIERDLMELAIMAVPCRGCGARAGQPCRVYQEGAKHRGRPVDYHHKERVKDGRRPYDRFRDELHNRVCPVCGQRCGFYPHRCPEEGQEEAMKLTKEAEDLLFELADASIPMRKLARDQSKAASLLIQAGCASIEDGVVELTDLGRSVYSDHAELGNVPPRGGGLAVVNGGGITALPWLSVLSEPNRERIEALAEAWGVDVEAAVNVAVAQTFMQVVADWRDASED